MHSTIFMYKELGVNLWYTWGVPNFGTLKNHVIQDSCLFQQPLEIEDSLKNYVNWVFGGPKFVEVGFTVKIFCVILG